MDVIISFIILASVAYIILFGIIWLIWKNITLIFTIVLSIGALLLFIWIIKEPARYWAERLSIQLKEQLEFRKLKKDLKNKKKQAKNERKIKFKLEKNLINQKFSSVVMTEQTRQELSRLYKEADILLFKQETERLNNIDELIKNVYDIHNSEFNKEDKLSFYQNIKSNINNI